MALARSPEERKQNVILEIDKLFIKYQVNLVLDPHP
jgi:hypothetical protein